MRIFAVTFILSLFIFSCKKNSSEKYSDSKGPTNTITVVADTTEYKNIVHFLKDTAVLGTTLKGMTVPESRFAIRNFTPNDFKKFPQTRLVLKLSKGKPNIKFEEDKNARHQAYIEVFGENQNEQTAVINQYRDSIYNEFVKTDLDFIRSRTKATNNKKKIEKIGISANIPDSFVVVEQKDDLIWFRKDKRNVNKGWDFVNLIFTKVPNQAKQINDTIALHLIDAYTLQKIKGAKKENHAEIERNLPVYITKTLDSKQTEEYLIQGNWSMQNEQLGGPLVAKIILDKVKNTITIGTSSIVALAQSKKKREYILESENIFLTLKNIP
ncbi:MAG: DUF4837 family protein [Flavobacteriales bacterium]|nr:DUF4837 family protein [Flavobacteriales bacterium]